MKLRQEFSLLASVLIIVVIAGISSAFFIYEQKLLIRQMKTNEINIFESFMEMSDEALSLRDELLLLNYLKLIEKINENVVYMIFTSVDGHKLSAPHITSLDYALKRESQEYESKELPAENYYASDGSEIYDIARSVVIDGKSAGIAQIGFSQDVLMREVKRTLKETGEKILLIALFALGIGIFSAILLARRITDPIKEVIKGAKSIGDGNLDKRIGIKNKNEFGDMAEEFNKMAVKLKELDEMKDNFISSVSHELKSPLYYIKGHIDLFLIENKKSMSKKSEEYFTVIKSNIKRLSEFISDVLDLAKIKGGHLVLNKSQCNLRKIAMEAIAFCKPMADENDITLSVSIPENIREVVCDTEKIAQVLHNLLGNALKFTPKGGKIEISTEEKDKHIEVCVSDTGIGIPKDKVGTVFEKFRQIKENMDKVGNVKGTGLGLAIVKGIIDAHEESIWVESELNKGCRFIFTLNKNSNEILPVEKRLEIKLHEKLKENKNILVIDDDKKMTEVLGELLKKRGYKVTCALNGSEGLSLAREVSPGLIILDLMMPGINGFEVMRRLKIDKETEDIPIIVLTSSISDKNRERCFSLGALEYLDKSSYEDTLVKIIEV